jgi:hypothetical protein
MKLVTSNIPKDLYKITPIAVNFFIDHYFQPESKDKVEEIAVRFLKSGYTEGEDTIAYCDFDEDDDEPTPTCFEIVFNDKRYRDVKFKVYLKTLFHELCHADQYLSGRLQSKSTEEGKFYDLWYGKRFEQTHDYWKQPWEAEAYGTETLSYNKFVELYPELQLKRGKEQYNGRGDAAKFKEKVNLLIQNGTTR